MTRFTLFCAVLALGAAIPRAAADPPAETPSTPAAEAPPPEAPPPESERKLAIHGYLSQACAISDGNQVLGIPDDGTFDYRTAALQFRASLSAEDSFLIQFSQERLGESPIMAFANEIDLDWVFYERKVGVGTSLRVGRVRVPFGIFSEIRFVGPLLPFYRAPDVFYPVGGYAFSSVNGLMISRSIFAARPFSLDADLYAGEWSFPQDGSAARVQAKKGVGGQLWLRTPLQGLRFGLGGNRSTWSNLLNDVPGERVTHHRWVASVDGDFERFRLSAEYEEETSKGVDAVAGYVLGSLHINAKLNLNLQAARSHLRLDLPAFDEELSRDYGAGLSYAFRPDLVLKAEHHWATGRRFEEPGVTIFEPPLSANYAIVSLSVLF